MGNKRVGLDLGVPEGVTLAPIPNIDERYAAGSDGNIYCYSNARVNAKMPRPFRLQTFLWDGPYPLVSVVVDGKRRCKSVHSLVCRAYHGVKPSPIHEVRHLDGVPTNSQPDNLCWGTPAENEADKRRHGTVAEGERQGIAKLTDEAVRILRASIPRGLWNPIDAAKVFGVDPSVIRCAVRGESWKHVDSAEVIEFRRLDPRGAKEASRKAVEHGN